MYVFICNMCIVIIRDKIRIVIIRDKINRIDIISKNCHYQRHDKKCNLNYHLFNQRLMQTRCELDFKQ